MLALKIPPMVVFALTAVIMWFGGKTVPAGSFSLSPPLLLICLLIPVLAGCLLIARAINVFHRFQTTVDPLNPHRADSLVTQGVYRLTRNPMYLGLALVLLTWGVYLGNLVGIALIAVFVVYIDRFQIVPEEKALASRFGEEYDRYKASVRRWI